MFSVTFTCARLKIERTIFCKHLWYNKGYLVIESRAGFYQNFITADGNAQIQRH